MTVAAGNRCVLCVDVRTIICGLALPVEPFESVLVPAVVTTTTEGDAVTGAAGVSGDEATGAAPIVVVGGSEVVDMRTDVAEMVDVSGPTVELAGRVTVWDCPGLKMPDNGR